MEAKSVDSNSNKTLRDFIVALLVPLLINKAFMFYFGIHYSKYPGEGYGYGLVATLVFLVLGLARLIWKYRHHEDP